MNIYSAFCEINDRFDSKYFLVQTKSVDSRKVQKLSHALFVATLSSRQEQHAIPILLFHAITWLVARSKDWEQLNA